MENDPTEPNTIGGEKLLITLVLSPNYQPSTTSSPSLHVPNAPIAVPSSTRRRGLSAIVNHLLDRRVVVEDRDPNSDSDSDSDDDDGKLPPLSFEFLVQNRLLRTTIDAAARNVSHNTEQTLKVVYFPSRPSPETQGESETLPDWITSLAVVPSSSSFSLEGGKAREDGTVFAGGSDGIIRFYNSDTMVGTGSIRGHSGAVSCMDVIVPTANNNHHHNRNDDGGERAECAAVVATGSMDQTLVTHACYYRPESIDTQKREGEEGESRTGSEMVLHGVYTGGHTSSIHSVVCSPTTGGTTGGTGGWMASGDWNGGLCVWKIPSASISSRDNDDDHEETESKRSKHHHRSSTVTSSSKTTTTTTRIHETTPVISLRPHTQSVSGLSFSSSSSSSSDTNQQPPTTILTCSWDHSLRVINLETQNTVTTLAGGGKVMTCMARCGREDGVVATGHPDRVVRLWDLRVGDKGGGGGGGGLFADGTLRRSHGAWISAVEWTSDPYVLVSASHDGTVKIWDIRSSLPLHTVRPHRKGEKVLCLATLSDTSKTEGKVEEVGGTCLFSGGSDCAVVVERG